MRRKFLSIVLCVCMMMTMVPFAFAAEGDAENAAGGSADSSTIDLDQFIKNVTAANYNYDGKGITVKWSPVSGCYDTRADHECTVNNNVKATGNTPKRVNSGLTQFQIYGGENDKGEDHAVSVKNVNFVYEPADFTVCENTNWKGSFTASAAPAGQLYLMNTGDVTFEDCTFDKVVVTSFNCAGTTTVKNCVFSNVYNNYAIKDVRGENVIVTGNKVTNSGGGVMVSSTNAVSKVTVANNTFTKVDVAGTAPEDKVDTRGLIQIASSGDYTNTTFDFSGNTAENCGPAIRQLNNSRTAKIAANQLDYLTGVSQLATSGSLLFNAVAQIGDTVYESLAEAVAEAKDGDTVTLLKNIDLGSQTLNVNKSVIIDGGNSKYAIESTNQVVVTVTAASNTVTLSNLTLKAYNADGRAIAIAGSTDGLNLAIDSCVIETKQRGLTVNNGSASMNLTVKDSTISLVKSDGSAYDYDTEYVNSTTRGLSLWQMRNSQVNIENTTIQGFAYDVNNSGDTEKTDTMTVNITGCTLKGRAGINDWTSGTTWNVTNTKFHGINNEKGPNESFGCIVFNTSAENNNCNVNNCGFSTSFNETGKENERATEYMFAIRANGNNITVDKDVVSSDTSYMIMGNLTAKGGICEKGVNGNTNTSVVKLYGGFYNVDPSDYCADNLTGVPSGNSTYPWTVGTKSATKADVAVGAPAVNEPDVTYPDNSDEKTLLDNAQTALTEGTAPAVTGTGIDTAASVVANKNTVTANDEVVTKLNNQMSGTSATKDNTNIVIQTYMDMKITGVDATENKQSISVEIQPMYRTVATTADVNNGGEIVLTASENKSVNAVEVGEAQKLEVQAGYPVEVTIPVPTDFVADENNLVVKHEKNGKLVGYHDATYNTADNTITFTNDKGFSTFTVLSDARSASIQFTDKDGKNIDSAKSYGPSNVNDALPTTAAESGYVFNGWKFEGIDGVYTTLTDELLTKLNGQNVKATPDFSKRSSSSSGSTSTTYNVTVNAATNGAVAADKKTASKGTTVTITATPSAGYVVDSVKVVDKDGKDVAVTEKDGKYVFTMPASAVTVTGTFKAETPAPSGLPFVDVKSGDWFYDAVKYAYENGLMNGTSATTFAPNGTMNRAMIVTVLYRLEKSPAVTSAAKFTDVPAGQWYSDAVAWAAANNIVNGYDETTFGPLNAVTREQMAAILYRYEQYKGMDTVTLEENLNRFPDQDKISAYAVPAMQWAVGQKVINGNADGTLDPTGTATRAQVAQIFMNLLNK